jgi:hypothetical protein
MPSGTGQALASVDRVPFAAVARLREHIGEFRACLCLGTAVLVDIVGPGAKHHLLAVSNAASADHLAEAVKVAGRSLFGEG